MVGIMHALPNLDAICRLCLQPESGTVNIFESGQLSIPVRIMACATLEVQLSDGLPKSICVQCRFQLEKSYYFRKRCQFSDAKLRKHIRLLNAGKKSRVFIKSEDDDDDEDEDEQFAESLKFIHEEDIKLKLEEEVKRAEWMKAFEDTFRLEENERRARWMEEQEEKFRKEETQRLFEDFGKFVNSRKAMDKPVSVKNENVHFEISEISSPIVESVAPSTGTQPEETNTQKRPKMKKTPRKTRHHIPAQDTDNEITSSDQVAEEQEQILIYNDEEAENAEGTIQTFFLYDKNSEQGNDHQIIEIESEQLNEFDDELNRDENPEEDEENNLGMDIQEEEEEENDDFLFPSEYADCNNEDGDHISYQIEETGEIQYLKEDIPAETLSISDEEEHVQNMLGNPDIPQYKIEEPDPESPTSIPTPLKRKATDANISTQPDKKPTNINPIIAVNYAQISTEDLKIFKCSECPQSFTRENSLRRHASAHTKGREYSCDRCDKWFSCKSSLDRHIRIHTGEKPFTCDQCGKSYMQKEVLKRHMAIHSGERPYPCQHCSKAFVQKSMLRQHINAVHLAVPQIAKHDCHLCSKSFNHASGLSRHLLTHSGMKFRCSECGRSFNDKSSIRRHVLSVHSKDKDKMVNDSTRPSPKSVQNDSSSEYIE